MQRQSKIILIIFIIGAVYLSYNLYVGHFTRTTPQECKCDCEGKQEDKHQYESNSNPHRNELNNNKEDIKSTDKVLLDSGTEHSENNQANDEPKGVTLPLPVNSEKAEHSHVKKVTTNTIVPPSKYAQIYNQIISRSSDPQYHPSNIAIAIVAADRPEYLRYNLRSLRNVLYWNPNNTVIFQYGNSPRLNDVINEFGLRQVKNRVIHQYEGKTLSDGAQHIALHYKFVLGRMFEIFDKSQYFIVVEDDMIFSPDFLLYFSQVAPIVMNDDTIYAASAYNDNGFHGIVKNDNVVRRTDFFIGLGWLVKRKLWEQEWAAKWPSTHWDHFLREERNRKGRQSIYPEIPRVYHIGYKGTHSTFPLYEKYFRNIHLNLNGYAPLGISIKDGVYRCELEKSEKRTLGYLQKEQYVQFMDYYLSPNNPHTIYISNLDELNANEGKNLIVAYQAVSPMVNHHWFKISSYFGLWHSIPVRSEFDGVVSFYWANNNQVFLVATYSSFFFKYKSHFVVQFKQEQFAAHQSKAWKPKKPNTMSSRVVLSKRGQSCANACVEQVGSHSMCDLATMTSVLNQCSELQKYFPCKSCGGNIGYDQPAMDMEDNTCLYNTAGESQTFMTTCEGSHPKTRRLCACNEGSQIDQYKKEWELMISGASSQSLNPNL